MISVQNLLQRLSGNKLLLVMLLGLSVLSACQPKIRILKPVQVSKPDSEQETNVDKTEETSKRRVFQIALLLPFQLDHVVPNHLKQEDLQRSALALDFYQGFQLGLESVVSSQTLFNLHVLDTRDDVPHTRQLAQRPEVQSANLIVGPVYPKEILAFGQSTAAQKPLMISPLAASLPGEFNFPNLVTLTSPITAHAKSLAQRIVSQYRSGDQVVFYETNDSGSKQFLPQVRGALQTLNASIPIVSVQDEHAFLERARHSGKNMVVLGTSNTYELSPVFAAFLELKNSHGIDIQVFGHPNWLKIPFDASQNLELFGTTITSSYFVDPARSDIRQFQLLYQKQFHILATEFAFKGYDTGRYFGRLIEKYGADFSQQLIKEPYQGFHNSFVWEHHSRWGFVNQSAPVLVFRKGKFVPVSN